MATETNKHFEAVLQRLETIANTHTNTEVAIKAGQGAQALRTIRADANQLREGIKDYLEGNYVHPRSNRPHDCEHGVRYWLECEDCNLTHFEALLK